ncbi:MAG: transporter [Gemmatimonadota bacterium]
MARRSVLPALLVLPALAPGSLQGQLRTDAAASVEPAELQELDRTRRTRSAASSNVGYVDNAIVATQLQLRYENAGGVTHPDRAEFIYAKCGCYRELAEALGSGAGDPDAPGPAWEIMDMDDPLTTPMIATDLGYQDFVLDGEYAFNDRISVFGEVPFRSLDVDYGMNAWSGSGIGDLQAGLKYAAFSDADRVLTLQLKSYLPTGDAEDGLGTDHFSLEPGLLFHEGSGERWTLESELRLWIPFGGSTGRGTPFGESEDYASSIVRYGAGIGYELTPEARLRFTPVLELAGWHVNGGIVTSSPDGTALEAVAEDGSADIVNLKAGARFGVRDTDSIYIGYGTALTDDVWYDDVIRAEYRLAW